MKQGHKAIISQYCIHKMYDANGSSVTIVRLHTNQYIFRNLCEKLEEGMCCSRDFLFTLQAHWNGHRRGEIPETGK